MGLGTWNPAKKRHNPITKWEGSWVEEQTYNRGFNAAMRGVPYDQNPERSAPGKLAWSKGHNGYRTRRIADKERLGW